MEVEKEKSNINRKISKLKGEIENIRKIYKDSLNIVPEISFIKEFQQIEQIFLDLEKLEREEFPLRIAIVGNYSSGKSTIINSLIGEEIMPTGDLPTTAIISILKNGEQKVIAETDNGIKFINPNLIKEFKHKKEEKNNGKEIQIEEIKRLIIYHPSKFLNKVEIYDTPGFNTATYQIDDEITEQIFEEVDLIIWTFQADNQTATEKQKIEKIRKLNKKIIALLNKVDIKSPGDRDEIISYIKKEFNFDTVLPYSAQKIVDIKRQDQRKELLTYLDELISSSKYPEISLLAKNNFSSYQIEIKLEEETKKFITFPRDNVWFEYYRELMKILEAEKNFKNIHIFNTKSRELIRLLEIFLMEANNLLSNLQQKQKDIDDMINSLNRARDETLQIGSANINNATKNIKNIYDRIIDRCVKIENFKKGWLWNKIEYSIRKVSTYIPKRLLIEELEPLYKALQNNIQTNLYSVFDGYNFTIKEGNNPEDLIRELKRRIEPAILLISKTIENITGKEEYYKDYSEDVDITPEELRRRWKEMLDDIVEEELLQNIIFNEYEQIIKRICSETEFLLNNEKDLLDKKIVKINEIINYIQDRKEEICRI